MEINRIYQQPCLDTLKRMPDKFLDCVITSPPYWQLRDYGYPEQWGLEPTFQQYLEHLWSMMDEIFRVLKDEGTVWINLGDSYSTQSGTNAALAAGRSYQSDSTYMTNRGESGLLMKDKTLPNKCLLLLPHRFAIGCIDRGWIVRNDCIWAKRNGMPESVTDRFSKKHEYFFFMVKQEKYFFDLDSIRDNIKQISIDRYKYMFTGQEGGESGNFKGDKSHLIPTTKIPSENHEMFGSPRARQHRQPKFGGNKWDGNDTGIYSGKEWLPRPDGKNPGSVSDFWDITTKPSSNKHYASYNDELLIKPVLAGCPEGGIIYDPFMGTGSTAEVAIRSNRNYIGSEMSKEYCKIAEERLKPFKKQKKLF